MTEDNTFLRYLITEDIYLLKGEIREKSPHPTLEASETGYTVSINKRDSTATTCIVLPDLSQSKEETLQKILVAAKINQPDYAVHLDFESGHQNYLLFGVLPEMEKYTIINRNGVRVLAADGIATLNANLDLKKKLWSELQAMFLI